jgi:hypothetical protein
MAKPRVFISSTFYDLKQVREDLERFIREIGYEPVRNETGVIPYGKEVSPEKHAYREVELSDIIVSIIGGRFGSESTQNDRHSITMCDGVRLELLSYFEAKYNRGTLKFLKSMQRLMSSRVMKQVTHAMFLTDSSRGGRP